VLLVAATPLELAPFRVAETLVCGLGPVEAAATTALRLASGPRPGGILHLGIAGARDLVPGTLVLGLEAVYCDLSTAEIEVVRSAAPDPGLLERAREALPEAVVTPIGTSANVGGAASGADVEAMEGFAVLRAAELAGVPAIELRAVSNRYADTRADWEIQAAIDALSRAVPRLLEALDA
jgi:predicted 5'-methylthioadenosine/S-adenosylhomocysteine nucleosidase